jgi:hypothetical protein
MDKILKMLSENKLTTAVIVLCILSIIVAWISCDAASRKLAENPEDKFALEQQNMSLALAILIIFMSTAAISACQNPADFKKGWGLGIYIIAFILCLITFIMSCLRIKEDRTNNILLAVYIAIIFGLCSYKYVTNNAKMLISEYDRLRQRTPPISP